MPSTLLEKVALAGWNDTDPLSLAKARIVLRVVREEVGRARTTGWVWDAESLDALLFPEEDG